MDQLTVPHHIFDEMIAYCEDGLPNEVCGILAGNGSEVSALYKMTNSESSPVSYLMDPKEQFLAMKDMRGKGLSMLAIFHSHPASAAYPSAKDVSLAFYDECTYLIVSLAEREPVVKGFSIKEGKVKEIGLVLQ